MRNESKNKNSIITNNSAADTVLENENNTDYDLMREYANQLNEVFEDSDDSDP